MPATDIFPCRWFAAGILFLGGCRMGVPIHVWQPPSLESTVGKRVAVTNVIGPNDFAEPIKQRMISMAPRDVGRATTTIDPDSLPERDKIRLVSGSDDELNDLAVASAARHEGIDYLLRGQIISTPDPPLDSESDARPGSTPVPHSRDTLRMSWRLISLADNRHVGGSPVVVDRESAFDRYPDLALVPDATEAMATAAVRETYRLLTPSVTRERVQLAISYGIPGSRSLRHGNLAALQGRWGEAEEIWAEIVQHHPTQVAALHNLALAAVAAQDFTRAKRLGRQAVRRQPTRHFQQTLVWIEQKQRQYHESFGLPDPPEGWFVTKSVDP